MHYKIGDKVIYKESPTLRRIRDMDDNGNLLLWGMYQYVSPESVAKPYCSKGIKCYNSEDDKYEMSEEEFYNWVRACEFLCPKEGILKSALCEDCLTILINTFFEEDINEGLHPCEHSHF